MTSPVGAVVSNGEEALDLLKDDQAPATQLPGQRATASPELAAPTIQSESAEPVAAPASASEGSDEQSLLGRYVGYVAYFVGTGLISGAMVHHPLDPSRYTKIGALGVLVFLFGTIFNEFVLTRTRPGIKQLSQAVGLSLLLSFGIGMLAGGLQHFEDFPDRAAKLIPAGIVLSFAAYIVKHAPKTWDDVIGGRAGLIMAAVVLIAIFGLRHVAAGIEPAEGGHNHGSTATVTEEADKSLDENDGLSHDHADH